MMGYGFQRPLQTTIKLEFTDSGVVVLNSATRNAKSKAQYRVGQSIYAFDSTVETSYKVAIYPIGNLNAN